MTDRFSKKCTIGPLPKTCQAQGYANQIWGGGGFLLARKISQVFAFWSGKGFPSCNPNTLRATTPTRGKLGRATHSTNEKHGKGEN
jgi:hypothetical protein